MAPRWWPWHLALVAVLVSFGWLGSWQLDSFRAGAVPRPAGAAEAPLAAVTEPGGRLGADEVGRRVRAEGTWLADGQVVVPDRPRPGGGRSGSWVVTPLQTDEGVLPVVRGWARGEVPTPPAGRVEVSGLLQASEAEPAAAPVAGTLPPGQVPYVATVTLLAELPYEAAELYDGYLVAADVPADLVAVTPREGSGEGVGRWRNLAYGLQWWVFAGAAVLFWALVLRRAAQERPPGAPQPPTGQPAQPGAGGPPPPLVAPRRRT